VIVRKYWFSSQAQIFGLLSRAELYPFPQLKWPGTVTLASF